MSEKLISARLKTLVAEEHVKEYYKKLLQEIEKAYNVASEARKKGFDVTTEVETKPVSDLADRAETIIGPKGVAKRYRELMKEIGERDKVIFQIFREILEEKWCSIPDREKRLEQAIKTALVLATEGVVVAPLDGVPKVKISKNPDGTEYVDIYYAGPIRAAGGTSAVLPLILGDYARQILNLDRYKPTEDEIERYVEEVKIYESIFSRQYKLTDDEVRKIIRGCPVCINGEPTEEKEVVIYRDLPRVHTNKVRGGACLVLSEGIALKAKKILRFAEQLGLDWSWLEEIIKVEKSSSESISLTPITKYLEGLAAGRPVLAYPLRFGGFRLRYGRTRATGIMCKALHPATMYVLDEFIAVATQLKIERPGKSAGITPCDSIEGPIVKLKNGDVKRIETVKEAIALSNEIEEILFLGDILIPIGDFLYTAHPLPKPGYCEEWWQLELEEILKKNEKIDAETRKIAEKALKEKITAMEAIELSRKLKIALYPGCYTFIEKLEKEEIVKIAEQISNKKNTEGNLTFDLELKPIFEKICLPHKVVRQKIVLDKENSVVFRELFGSKELEYIRKIANNSKDSLEFIEKISGIKVKEKGGTFIGARMGRPEAAGERIMRGSPHVLFPIELYGGSTRSITKALNY
ncbi:MAG: DNA polymerase II large subunit, partial [Candidatus Diapherotrites archaeon]|nr:DNA polymerase II large subunit [Candidatus Diapherotrites archaeon]